MKNAELENWILIVNLCILGALIFQYFRGAPSPAIWIAALACFTVANLLFLVFSHTPKKAL